MKFARQFGQLLLLALLSPSAALALGLGDIHLKSTLDAPLDADIELVDADAEDLSTLKATLAPRETFKRLGADYPSFLGTLTLTPERSADGHTVIHVHSSSVADEPFATLLVEVDWSRGHLVREYTVLLDPPVFNSQTPSNAAVAAPVAGASERGGLVEHGAGSAAGTTSSAASSAVAGAAATAGVAPTPATVSPDNSETTASNTNNNGATTPSNTAAGATGSGSTASTGSSTSSSSASATEATATPPPSSQSSASASGTTAASSSTDNGSATASAGSTPNSSSSSGSGSSSSPGSTAQAHAPGSYTVRRGDTLSRIADQNYGGDSSMRARALVAIYRANPKAFHDNMNTLYSGAVLQLPGDSELEAIGPGEAISEVRHQYDSWRTERGGESVAENAPKAAGQLRLVAPQEGGEPAPAASSTPSASNPAASAGGQGNSAHGAAANAALQQRVQQLESQLAESQRLLQLRNEELAALQARVQQENHPNGAASTPAPPPAVTQPPATQPAVSGPPPSVPAQAPPATPPAPQQPAAAAPGTAPVPPAVKPAAAPHAAVPTVRHPRVPAAPARSGGSVLDLVEQYWYVGAGLLALAIVLLGLRWMRSRQEDAFDRSLGELSDADEAAPAMQRTDTVPVRTIAGPRQEPSYHVEESGTHQRPDFDDLPEETSAPAPAPAPAPARAREPVALEEPTRAEAPVALDQGDPMAEADFHMAYGLYDQAAELVQIAINREPKRRDLKLKLLEVFFVWGNRDRFLQTAHQLAASRDQAPAGEWEKILIMGRQIAPDDALFADSRGVAGAAKVVDLNLEGGQNRVDFDLHGEPSLGTPSHDGAVELDLGAALGEANATEATGEAPQVTAGGVDFPLDAHGSDATGTTREMPGAGTGTTQETTGLHPAMPSTGSTETVRVLAEPEVPTVEQPQIRSGDHGTLRQKIDAAARHAMTSGEQTAELAIDDLGLDLGALEGTDDEPLAETADPDSPTLLADVDEDTRRMFEAAETGNGAGQRAAAARGGAEKGAAVAAAHEVEDAHGTDVTQRAPAAAAGAARGTGTWMFTDTDFASISPVAKPTPTHVITQIAPQPQLDTGSTAVARASVSASDELDLDLGAGGHAKAESANGVDLDVGTPPTEGSYVDTQRLSGQAVVADDTALPDLEPVTLSEVGTKLDLARAYMDMGDPEGARSILSEVMSEGSVSQKQEARRLIDALPG